MSFIATAMAAVGLWQYTNAAPSFPYPLERGAILIRFVDDAPSALNVAVEQYGSTPTLTVEVTTPASEPCMWASVTVAGIPAYRVVMDREEIFSAEPRPGTEEGIEVDTFSKLLSVCSKEDIQFLMNTPAVRTSGSVTTVSFPHIEIDGVPKSDGITATWRADWSQEDLKVEDLKPEVVSTGYSGSGFQWQTKAIDRNVSLNPDRKAWPLHGPTGTFISVEKERAASRSLFWAGLLTGSAVSLYAWGAEVWLERRRAMRSRNNPEDAMTTEQVAKQVLRLLDQRATAGQTHPQALEPEHRGGTWRDRR